MPPGHDNMSNAPDSDLINVIAIGEIIIISSLVMSILCSLSNDIMFCMYIHSDARYCQSSVVELFGLILLVQFSGSRCVYVSVSYVTR